MWFEEYFYNYAARKSKSLAFKVHWVLSRGPICGGSEGRFEDVFKICSLNFNRKKADGKLAFVICQK